MLRLAKMLLEADMRFAARLIRYLNKGNRYSFIRRIISNYLWYAIDADDKAIQWINYMMAKRGLN